MNGMNERDLRYLLAIVETGNLRLASLKVHVTQPALSKCISRLEDQVGAPLFARRGRLLHPTAVGQVLARRAQSIVRSIDETQREIADYARGLEGHIRLGAAATLTELLMPAIIERLSEVAPGVTIELTVGMSNVLREALRADKLDVVIGPVIESQEFDCQPLLSDEVVIVASRRNQIAAQARSLSDLRGCHWLLPQKGVAMRVWLEQAFENLGEPPPAPRIEVSSLVLMPRLIARTDLLSFISRRTLQKSDIAEQLVELPFPETVFQRKFGIITRRNGYVPTAGQLLIDLVMQQGSDLFAAEEDRANKAEANFNPVA
jgi:DNA-binding transcriptional LysR family regulator